MIKVKHYSKIAVFDLDGTLYIGNSHLEILNTFFNTRMYTSFLFKILCRVFSSACLNRLYFQYRKIPKDYSTRFVLRFRESAICKLREMVELGYEVIIISNAPEELILSAASILGVKWLKADIGKKGEKLIENFSYDLLFVCTDNLSDIDLLQLADTSLVYSSARKKKYFNKYSPLSELKEE